MTWSNPLLSPDSVSIYFQEVCICGAGQRRLLVHAAIPCRGRESSDVQGRSEAFEKPRGGWGGGFLGPVPVRMAIRGQAAAASRARDFWWQGKSQFTDCKKANALITVGVHG